jgi:hypothetical protein
MSKKLDQTKISRLENFLQEAFCIDKKAGFDKFMKVEGRDSMQFKLEDSQRGIFYVIISK